MNLVRVAVVGLASTRLVRAIQHETVGSKWRTWVDRLSGPKFRTRLDGEQELDVKATVRAEQLYTFLSCDLCFGYWVTVGVVLAWRYRPLRPLIEALAASVIVSVAAEHYPNWRHED